ncbi:MAG: MetQ/NlpA family ABC transporter substrate-binding protein [Sulfurospirillaceae bacterium]|nr:MetQ/NlpA family ABC transporter substrate-binding protein [Sulfurospirillaceae bacterium]MDD2825942.1 MetQ/NlpA family ABC transporter substrate-binding protein [Sulfurospirillaceae bacterium]
MRLTHGFKSKSALLVATLFLVFAGNAYADAKHLVIGISPGPYGDLFKQAIAPSLEKKGYSISIKEFSDYVQPNLALSNKSIDANLFQHETYLKKFSADKGLKLSALISVPTAGVGIYSKKYKTVADIKDGASLTLPNDPTNLARALSFLQTAGLIKIKPELDPTKASEKDIVENPKHLKIHPLEAAQIPRTLDSVDVAVATGNYAIASGIYPTAIDREVIPENYINVIAVRTDDLQAQFVKDIKEIVESEAFAKVMSDPAKIFKDFQKPAWLKAKNN